MSSTESAKRAAKTNKRALATPLHNAAYGVSYGLVYAGVFITELMPEDNLVRRGLAEGADAALSARRKAMADKKSKSKSKQLVKATPAAKAPRRRVKASPRARKAVEKRAAAFDAATAAGVS